LRITVILFTDTATQSEAKHQQDFYVDKIIFPLKRGTEPKYEDGAFKTAITVCEI
jgi:hypothetical protein